MTFAPRARQDLRDIYAFYRETRGVEPARKTLRNLRERARQLESFPEIGARRDDLKPGLRALACRRYLIFYQSRQGQVVILRVLRETMDVAGELL